MFKKTLIITFVLMVIGTAFWYTNTAKAQQFVTDGLVSFWTFDNSNVSGKTIKDVWGKSDGTIIGGDPQLVAGKIGDALKLDGKVYVEMPKDSPVDKALIGAPNFTVEFWANVSSDAKDQGWFGKGEGAQSKAIRIRANPGGAGWLLHFWDNDWNPAPAIVVDAAAWQHMVFTFDGKSNVGQMYKNGELSGTHTYALVNFASSVVWIGKEVWAGASIGKGMIDEVRVYSKVLTQKEVTQNFLVNSVSPVESVGKLSTTWGSIKGLR
jgi:hypothetical protein